MRTRPVLLSLNQQHPDWFNPRVCVFVGKLGSEEENKEEFRMEREPPATHEEGTVPSLSVRYLVSESLCVSEPQSSCVTVVVVMRFVSSLQAATRL